MAHRSSAEAPGGAAGAGLVVGGAVAGVVAGVAARGFAVVVTGLGFTVVDVEVDVDVELVVDDVVLDVEGGGARVVSGAGVAGADADASVVHHTNVAPAMATTVSTAATL